jgi:hypothetical protein
MRKLVIAAGAVMAISGAAASAAGAAPNPAGTGQPGAFFGTSCGSGTAITQPKGFTTGGFATAGGVYANPGTTSGAANAVSEYDIACYQLTTNH